MNNVNKIGGSNITGLLTDFLVKPAASGLYGFAVFLVIIIISKFLGHLIGSTGSFQVDISDVNLSFLGFFFLFLIRLLKNIQKRRSDF